MIDSKSLKDNIINVSLNEKDKENSNDNNTLEISKNSTFDGDDYQIIEEKEKIFFFF